MRDNDFIFKIVNLEINPLSTPKAAKRELREILRKYEYDDDFINNINDDITIGYAVAIDIVKRMVVYNSSIEVPDNITLKEAIDYAKEHIDEIPSGELEYISDSDELNKENCDFDDEE